MGRLLLRRKAEAVAAEDYDMAKALKAQIARVRAGAGAGAPAARRPQPEHGAEPGGAPGRPPGQGTALRGGDAGGGEGYGGGRALPASPGEPRQRARPARGLLGSTAAGLASSWGARSRRRVLRGAAWGAGARCGGSAPGHALRCHKPVTARGSHG